MKTKVVPNMREFLFKIGVYYVGTKMALKTNPKSLIKFS
jgi:hypothetical protein